VVIIEVVVGVVIEVIIDIIVIVGVPAGMVWVLAHPANAASTKRVSHGPRDISCGGGRLTLLLLVVLLQMRRHVLVWMLGLQGTMISCVVVLLVIRMMLLWARIPTCTAGSIATRSGIIVAAHVDCRWGHHT
jgi:hypothetical protein